MGVPLATWSDVEAIWRPLSDQEKLIANTRCAQASDYIRARVPNIDDRIASGTIDSGMVAAIVADMVLRVMINPERARSVSRAIADYQRTVTIDQSVSAGALYLTNDELMILRGRRSRAFTIMPSPGERWCPSPPISPHC